MAAGVSTGLLNALVNGVVTGSIVALGAIGLALVYSIAGVPNFAHGELLTLGAYVALVANRPGTVPGIGGLLADDGGLTAVGVGALFLVSVLLSLSAVYATGGREALRGGWASDPRLGVAGNAVLSVAVGAVVALWAPSVWAGAVLAGVALAVAAPAIDGAVFDRFRERGSELATMLIVALGVSFVLRFGTQAVYGGDARRLDIPRTVGAFGYETNLTASKLLDLYLTSGGLVVDVIDTATDATVATVGYGWVAVSAATVAAAVAGYLGYGYAARYSGLPALRPAVVAPVAAAATLAVSALVLGAPAATPSLAGRGSALTGTRVRVSALRLLIIGVSLCMMVSLHTLLTSTKLGKAMRASSDNLDLARVTGIDTDRVMTVTWVVAGLFAGAGGVLLGMRTGNVSVTLGFDILIPMFAAVILGGVGSVYGAILGSYAVGLSMDLGVYVVPGVGPEYRIPMAFVVLLLVLLVKPEGLRG